VRIVATVTTVEILPMETIIRSITWILSQDINELSSVRYALVLIIVLHSVMLFGAVKSYMVLKIIPDIGFTV
jgi:hypothetical protein